MHPRVPVHCPPGFTGRYTVVPGDTMFFIAQRFGVSLNALIAANPHITNPNLIFPGDVLCVPPKFPPPPPPPPPPKKVCPCPITLKDFISRLVEVTTLCEVVRGFLTSVDEDSITITDPKTSLPTIVLCKNICFVRIIRHHHREEE